MQRICHGVEMIANVIDWVFSEFCGRTETELELNIAILSRNMLWSSRQSEPITAASRLMPYFSQICAPSRIHEVYAIHVSSQDVDAIPHLSHPICGTYRRKIIRGRLPASTGPAVTAAVPQHTDHKELASKLLTFRIT